MNLSSALLFTMIYGDMFQYPYTEKELIAWIPKKVRPVQEVRKRLRILMHTKKISYTAPYYYLFGHGTYIDIRIKRERCAQRKMKRARFAASVLSLIPTITLVGVTGGLALRNADKEDDIDLYVGVTSGTVWTSRLLATIAMELLGIRRHPGDSKVSDMICLNMFVSDKAFAIPKNEQDIFTAHEVLQMQPIWDRGGAYVHFLQKNSWTSVLFPNKWNEVLALYTQAKKETKPMIRMDPVGFWLRMLEGFLKHIQLRYMSKRRTAEIVTDLVIRFHPRDARIWVRRLIEQRSKDMHLPLDKDFFQT